MMKRLSRFLTPPLTAFFAIALPSVVMAEAVCVQSKHAVLRKGPASRFPVSWTVGQHMPFLRISEKNGWSEVKDLDNQIHWVASRALTSKFQCAVVKAKQAKITRDQGSKSPASVTIEVADRYTPFRKVDRDGAQLLVQDEEKVEYWIAESAMWTPTVRTHLSF